jgi:SagB-type dehydrogenase family enzyme
MAWSTESVPLPSQPENTPLAQLLEQRRSMREFRKASLTLQDLARLLWAAQGVTDARGLRTAPSAGALYPLELYVVAGNVDALSAGVYHYDIREGTLRPVIEGDVRKQLAQAAYGQSWMNGAAAVVVFTAIYHRTTRKYGKRGIRYVHIEAGHAAQNLFLQAQAGSLATVVVGAFDDDRVSRVLHLPAEHRPLLLMPLGRRP